MRGAVRRAGGRRGGLRLIIRAACVGGGVVAGSARTRSRDQGRWSIKSNSLKEDIEGRKPAKTLAGPVVDQIKDPVKLRL